MFTKGRKTMMLRVILVCGLMAGVFGILPAKATSSVGFGWAKRIGGASYDVGTSLAVDASGNVYSTGNFSGTADFDPGPNAYNLTSAGNEDISISKLDANGNFLWAKRIGSTLSDAGSSIVLDGIGNLYNTGTFSGTVDFDPGPGTYNLSSAGSYDIYLSKMDANGNLVWAKSLGGIYNDYGTTLKVDNTGNIYMAGYFVDTVDFDPNPGVYNLITNGYADAFVSKFDLDGNLVWARNMGGPMDDYGRSLAIDGSGNAYSIGAFYGTADFDPGPGVYNLSSGGYYDMFISKLNINGEFIWAKRIGGIETAAGTDIEVDGSGNVYSTGYFENTVDFDPGAAVSNLTSAGYSDIFISKLDAGGNFVWAKAMGGAPISDSSDDIAVDAAGSVYAVGAFGGTVDFDPGAGIYNLTAAGSADIFISKLDANGNFGWARNMGGPAIDYGRSLVVDEIGNVYSIGEFAGTADFDPGTGTYTLTGAGYIDVFISKLTPLATFEDVPAGYWAWNYIERLYSAGITGGCNASPLQYCPEGTVTRAQMAVFLLRGIHTSAYTPPAVGAGSGFGDVPVDYWSGAWIKQLAAEGITTGCGNGNYCPEHPVTRAQMAVFLLRSKHGTSYSPPGVGVGTGFGDVQPDYWAAAWIKQLVTEGITSGCGNGNYCPEQPVTRAQMAVFLVRTFSLP